MRIAQEEVFGPILSVIPFANEEEAASIANATDYGLAAGVWTADLGTAHRMIRKIRAGVVHVNCYGGADITVPLGGRKQSGNGFDKSLHALEKFTGFEDRLESTWISDCHEPGPHSLRERGSMLARLFVCAVRAGSISS